MNFYERLGVSSTATAEEIKSAFKKLAMSKHPDRNGGSAESEKEFKEINEAYETLKDPQKRAQYDDRLNGRVSFNAGQQFHAGRGFDPFGPGGPFGDIFRHFNQGNNYGIQKNPDLLAEYFITLEEAYFGKKVNINLKKEDGTSETVSLDIPPGVDNGWRILIPKKGHANNPKLEPGDLYVTITIKKHETFMRHGLDLLTSIKVDYFDAMLGCFKNIKFIDGSTISIIVPENTHPGKILKLDGKGMKKTATVCGNLLVEIQVVPPSLTEKQKEQLIKIKSL